MDINWGDTALSALVIFIATTIHSIVGFGMAQVAMGLMPLFRSPASASAIFSILAVVSNARVWWSVRENFDWRAWLAPVGGLAVGMPLGMFVFTSLNESQLRIAIGITLLVAVVLMATVRRSEKVKAWLKGLDWKPDWKIGVLAGFLAGVLGGAVAIPGPPMILYGAFMVAADFWKDDKMKAIFTAFFGTLMLYRVISLMVVGSMSVPLAIEAAVALPALFLGAWIGIKIYKLIPDKIFGWIVLGLLTVNAFILIFTS